MNSPENAHNSLSVEELPRLFFQWLVTHPKRIVIAALLLFVAAVIFIPQLTKDTRADAFLAEDNSALVYREKVKALFGLSDPMVIAVVGDNTIFTVAGLNVVETITEMVINLDNVDPDGVTSLATENNIVGTQEGMEVSAFYDGPLQQQTVADGVRDAIRDFPLYQGSLVAQDESATLIVAELLDETQAEQTYDDLISSLDELTLPQGYSLHVAGEGAISGYLGSYIDADAQRLNPLAGVIITIIVFIAFLRIGPTLMANIVIAASVLITLGVMAAVGVPFYVITNALPVILIGIAVADSIHIYSEYFERRAKHSDESFDSSIVATMLAMWRPITLTTLTTVAGFMGLYLAAYMPPFKFFGLFTALGVSLAWLYSLIFLPAVMSLLKTEVRPQFARKIQGSGYDMFGKIMVALGQFTQARSKTVVAVGVVIGVVGLLAASQLLVDEDRIKTFHPTERLYIADQEINSRFDGTNYLDIVVETDSVEGIFDPAILRRMEALQVYAETLPGVQGTTSIVDYLKQMNRALNNGSRDYYRLPEDRDLIAQYFLLYSASSDPTDFEEEVDYDYRLANIRVTLNTGAYSENKMVVEQLDDYLVAEFNTETVIATLSGRVNLNYHWIKDLGQSHFAGMAIALLLVWLVSSLLFRSAVAGVFALLPVATSILLVYSTMVLLSIPLGIGTSMFAAVAIGLGVDFAIHTIDRLRRLYKKTGDMEATIQQFYPTTGRALFFNLLAIAFGFGVLISSKVVPLTNFGTIVAMSVITSFLVSMTLLPALVQLTRPAFITGTRQAHNTIQMVPVKIKTLLGILLVATVTAIATTQWAEADDSVPQGRWVMEQVNLVDEGIQVSRKLSMTMTDKRGKVRQRETLGYRKYFGDEKRTVLFYLSPKNVKDTGFLTYDYPDENIDDDQWLYLPALRKARRISASDRGDYFLGTDFTYEDIKNEGKVELSDYEFKTLGKAMVGDKETLIVESIPVDAQTAKELGYGKVHSWVDTSNWMIIKTRYWDIKQNDLKTLTIDDIRKVDGIWTRHQLTVDNHKTGHRTEFVFSEVDYQSEVDDQLFTRRSLTRGAR